MADPLTRRHVLALGAVGAIALSSTACDAVDRITSSLGVPDPSDGRLTARPRRRLEDRSPATGRFALGVAERRDAIACVPRAYTPTRAWPLVVGLHGAGGRAKGGLRLFQRFADERGLIVLAPPSRAVSWDVRYGGFGPDVAFIDRALRWTFERYSVDRGHLMLAGFSDGASYALSLGLLNGDLFSHLCAFSPGFIATDERHGKPEIFIAHGVQDPVLPIDQTSRKIVPQLRHEGYDVTYLEFEGVHHVEPENQERAVEWFLG